MAKHNRILEHLTITETVSNESWFDFTLTDASNKLRGELKAAEIPQRSKKLWITSITIHKTLRGQGLGSYLLSEVIRRFEQRGFLEIYVDIEQTDGATETDLDAFFGKHGFEPTDLESKTRNTLVLCRML